MGTLVARPDILDVFDGDRDCVAVEDAQRSVEYAALEDNVRAIARLLTARGVRHGDRVAVSIPNSEAAVEIYLACAAMGSIWVGVNPSAPDGEKRRQLDVVGPRVIIDDADAMLAEALSAQSRVPLAERPDLDLPCAIAFTSGTTGAPKTIVHSRAAVSLAATSIASVQLRSTDRVGVTLPLSIHNVMIVGPLAALVAGCTTVVLDRLNARDVASACGSRALTLVRALVPATIYDLVHDVGIVASSLSTLRQAGTGAAGLAEDLRSEFEAKFGVRLVGSYGLSEAPAAVCSEDAEVPRSPGASGTPLPHVSLSIRDGEVWIGPAIDGPWAGQYRPALGSWADGQLVPRESDQPSFATGDMGWLDSNGALHVSGRKSDVIVRGGVNVTATELATVLGEIDGVREVALVGREDPRLGERIVAFVEAESGATLDVASLRTQAATLLSHSKVPDQFVIVDALPRNAMGKVVRGELRE